VAPNSPKSKGSLKFQELAEKYTNGKVKVEVYPNSQLYKDKEEVDALQLGAVQMLAPSLAKFGPLGAREFEVFDLPYILPSKAALRKVTSIQGMPAATRALPRPSAHSALGNFTTGTTRQARRRSNTSPRAVARLTPGRELGWPYCNPDGGPANLPFIRDVQTNADGSKLDCASLPPVEQSLGAHAAPLGMSFTQNVLPAPYASGALVGVHGSWNRQPPYAPEVAFFPWQNGGLGNLQTLVGGFQAQDGSRWGRPVAAVTGPDGAVYITDDSAGAVYRLAPR